MHCKDSKLVQDVAGRTGCLRWRHLLQSELCGQILQFYSPAPYSTNMSSRLCVFKVKTIIKTYQDSSGLALTCLKVDVSLFNCNSCCLITSWQLPDLFQPLLNFVQLNGIRLIAIYIFICSKYNMQFFFL